MNEIIFVSKGQLSIVWGERKRTAQEGSFVFFDPQETELHYLMNETDQEVEAITFSVKRQDDVVIYENSKLWQPPTLETSRLILRPIDLGDADSIFAYAKNPNVCKYTLWEAHQSV